MLFGTLSKLAAINFAILAAAHPGEHHEHNEAAELKVRDFKQNARRGLASCADKLEKRGISSKAATRRAALFEKHSRKKNLARDTATVANTSHLSDATYNPATPDSTVFASNSTCYLNPEGETGPFWVKGEHLRYDLQDGQPGVPVIIEGQFLDVETCEPIEGLWWDLWNCNSTGVYSGVVSAGNGNTDDTGNLDKTFLRGIQPTDSEGVVTFKSIFPGHYAGRATHHHMVAHLNATLLPNNTLSGGTVAHVGQIFWDQSLIYAVEDTYPYNTNTIAITTNADDRVFAEETADTETVPVFEYVYLGDSLEDGIFGWVTVAVNVSATYDPNYSFVLTDEGGVAESGGGAGTGTGTGAGNGTSPSGALPSGAAPSGA
ncbi:aromatic compound dioxygenase [Hyaloscypha variabilis F]|uniref:Aromatic compound dioxygenase n=1 Tax=Hyaloscypha variabilis (strain UAMH 11265 / GT02V1 / F) TaxID=1149755 RepID=A0A2J6QYJ8_HYAVF|nr:aromatic compound dioxygenase [Hyaloscypha variabilis F]